MTRGGLLASTAFRRGMRCVIRVCETIKGVPHLSKPQSGQRPRRRSRAHTQCVNSARDKCVYRHRSFHYINSERTSPAAVEHSLKLKQRLQTR